MRRVGKDIVTMLIIAGLVFIGSCGTRKANAVGIHADIETIMEYVQEYSDLGCTPDEYYKILVDRQARIDRLMVELFVD